MSQGELDAITDKVLAYNPNGDAPLEVIAGTADKPLVIGQGEDRIGIPCYVLEDETHVLIRRYLAAIARTSTTSGSRPISGLPRCVTT